MERLLERLENLDPKSVGLIDGRLRTFLQVH